MKKTLYIAMAVAALSAISCQKEKELHPVGSRIVFSAATEFRNGLETRTLYTGQYTQTNPAFERIQWVSTDQIKILYSHGSSSSATYSIDESSIAGSGTEKKSTASISVASGSSALEWAEGSSHIFYGLYPADGGTLTAGSATGLTIPATQTVTWNADQSKYLPDMDKAYMVSYKDMSSSQNSTVDLPFTPVMNAVEFKLRLPDDRPSYTVTQVKFSASASTAIAGTYSVDINGFADDAVTWSVPNNGITSSATGILINFNNGSSSTNPAIPTSTSGNVLDFTVLTLPVAISNPTLQIKYSDGHVLKVALTGLSLLAGQKCIVSNSKAGHDDFTYVVSTPASQTITGHNAASFSQISVSSLKRSGANSSYTEPVAWKVQYTTDNGTTWTDGVPSTHTLTEDHTNNTFTVALAAANADTEYDNNKTPFAAATELLRARSSVGSTESPYDLSLHNAVGTDINRTTANCYVVTRPGVYKIPLIYGNAIVNGETNKSAYDVSDIKTNAWNSGTVVGSDDELQNYYLPAFYNSCGDKIDNPNIITDLLNLFGSNVSVSSLSTEVGGLDDTKCISNENLRIVGSGASAYIEMTVTEGNIKPGNQIVYLKGTAGNVAGRTLWSWHIWVTDKDLTPSSGIMPFNLGWVDVNTQVPDAVSKFTDRPLRLRIVQVDGGTIVNNRVQGGTVVNDDVTPFTLTQIGDVVLINNPKEGINTHYQWGRKDPYPGSESTIQLTQWADVPGSGDLPRDYGRGVAYPEVMMRSEKSMTWMDGRAIPLYEQIDNPTSTWWIQSGGHYTGPFSTAEKNSVSAISTFNTGATWTERMTTPEIVSYTVRSTSSANTLSGPTVNTMVNEYHWFEGTSFTPVNGSDPNTRWYFTPNSTVSLYQYSLLSNIANSAAWALDPPYGFGLVDWNNIVAIYNNQLQANYSTPTGTGQWDVSFSGGYPTGPYTDSEATTLAGTGHWTKGTTITETINHNYSYQYTSDSDRHTGSILYNLWSASLYNENATVSQKYKTVYDPCPAGFTVPTFGTYLNVSPSTLTNKRQDNISGFTGYPRNGYRNNVSASISNGGSANVSVSSGSNLGVYWTDHPCNMQWRGSAYPNKNDIGSYLYYTDAYILLSDSGSASLQAHARCDAASIRPMVDPRASSIAGHATPAQVSASNPIESVTMGPEL